MGTGVRVIFPDTVNIILLQFRAWVRPGQNAQGILFLNSAWSLKVYVYAWNTKGGSITVKLTSCLTGLDESVLKTKTKIVSCHAANSKPVKREVNCTVIVFPGLWYTYFLHRVLEYSFVR